MCLWVSDCWLSKRNNLKTSLAHCSDWPGKRLSGRRWSSPGSFAWWPSPVRPGRAAHAGTVCRCTWPQATDPRPSAHSTPALPERGDRKRCYFNLHQPFTNSNTARVEKENLRRFYLTQSVFRSTQKKTFLNYCMYNLLRVQTKSIKYKKIKHVLSSLAPS